MKICSFFCILLVFFVFSCNSKNEISEGVIVYSIEYPNNKDNFFLYHVLPKELVTSFRDDKMELKIKKANLENTVIIDSDEESITAYYSYGDVFNCQLTTEEIKKLKDKQPKYDITFLKEKDTLLGFNVKKAIAVDPNRPYDIIEIWYTTDIKFKQPNWFNGFEKIPGIMLKYEVLQFGLKMEFTAKKLITNQEVSDSILSFERPGKAIRHDQFDSLVINLFQAFK